MTEIEYQNFLKLPVIDRIVKMNSGTIKQNLDFMIKTSNAEKEVFMTEPIMINDVDVSECKLFTQEYDLDFSKCGKICTDTFCKYKHNCLLKQLKRKEQECERSKKIKDDYFFQLEAAHQGVLDKNKIIEEIEEIITSYQEPIELDALSLPTAIESILQRLQAENEELKKQLEKMKQEK